MRLILCLLTLSTLCAQAQFDISMKLPHANYMALEAISASIVITNRTGDVAILGGPGRGNWLSFNMKTSDGAEVATVNVSGADLVQMQPGASIQRRVTVTDAYSPTDIGNYAMTARVFHAPSGDYYESARARFSIVDAKPMWQQNYGVPAGFKDAGMTRKYSLHALFDVNSTTLYFRLTDDKTGVMLRTYRLGPLSMVYDPQITIDAQNQLQVLFLAKPELFAYATISPDGTLKKLAYYKQKGSDRPMLQQTSQGSVMVAGGEYFNPDAPPPATPKVGGRDISDRPPGL